MPLKRRREKKTHSRILDSAQQSADRLVDDDIVDELRRTGVVWSGLLGLDEAISPSDVAAMISSYELVKATRFVDSESYWSDAASFAAVGAFCELEREEPPGVESDQKEDDQLPIGFSPGHTTSPKN